MDSALFVLLFLPLCFWLVADVSDEGCNFSQSKPSQGCGNIRASVQTFKGPVCYNNNLVKYLEGFQLDEVVVQIL